MLHLVATGVGPPVQTLHTSSLSSLPRVSGVTSASPCARVLPSAFRGPSLPAPKPSRAEWRRRAKYQSPLAWDSSSAHASSPHPPTSAQTSLHKSTIGSRGDQELAGLARDSKDVRPLSGRRASELSASVLDELPPLEAYLTGSDDASEEDAVSVLLPTWAPVGDADGLKGKWWLGDAALQEDEGVAGLMSSGLVAELQGDQQAAYRRQKDPHHKRTAAQGSTDDDEHASQVQSGSARVAARPVASTSLSGPESISSSSKFALPPASAWSAPGAPSSPWPATKEWQEEVREVPCPQCSGRGYVRCTQCSQSVAGSFLDHGRGGGRGCRCCSGSGRAGCEMCSGKRVIHASLQELSTLLQRRLVADEPSASQLTGHAGLEEGRSAAPSSHGQSSALALGSGLQDHGPAGARESMIHRLAAQDLMVETLVDREFQELEERKLRARSVRASQHGGGEGAARLVDVEDEGGNEGILGDLGESIVGGRRRGRRSPLTKEHQDKMTEIKRQRREMFSALARRRWADKELREKSMAAMWKGYVEKDAPKKISQKLKAYFADPENRRKRGMLLKGKPFHCKLCGQQGHRSNFCRQRAPLVGPTTQDGITQAAAAPAAAIGAPPRVPVSSAAALGAQAQGRSFKCGLCGEQGHRRNFCPTRLVEHPGTRNGQKAIQAASRLTASPRRARGGQGGAEESQRMTRRARGTVAPVEAHGQPEVLGQSGAPQVGRTFRCSRCGQAGHRRNHCALNSIEPKSSSPGCARSEAQDADGVQEGTGGLTGVLEGPKALSLIEAEPETVHRGTNTALLKGPLGPLSESSEDARTDLSARRPHRQRDLKVVMPAVRASSQPGSRSLQSGQTEKGRKLRCCKICGGPGHDRRNCRAVNST